MIAAAVLSELNARGVTFAAAGDRLRLRAPAGTMTPDLLDRVRTHKAELLALLSGATGGGGASDWQRWYSERAAIIEHDGGFARAEAEARAFECCVAEWMNQHPPPANEPEDGCTHCGEPLADDALPFLNGAGGHVWMHGRCHAAWMKRPRAEAEAALAALGVTPT